MATGAEEPVLGISRGVVFWVAADVEGTKQSNPHPHVVVQNDVFNHSHVANVLVCAINTNLRRGSEPENVLLDPDEGGLLKQCVVIALQVVSVEKVRLGEQIGVLSAERVEQILAGMRFLHAIYFNG